MMVDHGCPGGEDGGHGGSGTGFDGGDSRVGNAGRGAGGVRVEEEEEEEQEQEQEQEQELSWSWSRRSRVVMSGEFSLFFASQTLHNRIVF